MIWAWENSTPKFIAPTYLGSSSLHLITLFRNKRFRLNEMFQRNASKFAMLTFIGQECEVSSWNPKRKKLLYDNKFCGISLEQFFEHKPLIFIEWNCISNIPLFCDFPKYLTNILYYARMVSVTDGVFRLCFGKGKVEYVNENRH